MPAMTANAPMATAESTTAAGRAAALSGSPVVWGSAESEPVSVLELSTCVPESVLVPGSGENC